MNGQIGQKWDTGPINQIYQLFMMVSSCSVRDGRAVANSPCSPPNSEIVFPVISTLKIRASYSQAIETQSISTNSSRPETAPSSLSPCYQGVTEKPLAPVGPEPSRAAAGRLRANRGCPPALPQNGWRPPVSAAPLCGGRPSPGGPLLAASAHDLPQLARFDFRYETAVPARLKRMSC